MLSAEESKWAPRVLTLLLQELHRLGFNEGSANYHLLLTAMGNILPGIEVSRVSPAKLPSPSTPPQPSPSTSTVKSGTKQLFPDHCVSGSRVVEEQTAVMNFRICPATRSPPQLSQAEDPQRSPVTNDATHVKLEPLEPDESELLVTLKPLEPDGVDNNLEPEVHMGSTDDIDCFNSSSDSTDRAQDTDRIPLQHTSPNKGFRVTNEVGPSTTLAAREKSCTREGPTSLASFQGQGAKPTVQPQQTWRCSWEGCNKVFSWPHTLRRHTKTHSGERPYHCSWDDCRKSFARRDELTDHTNVHTGDKPFQCAWDGCNISFAQRDELANHTKIHTNHNPFRCSWEGCNRSFRQRNMLARHTRTHTGVKPFHCTWEGCGRSFTSQSGLNGHTRTHTGDKPFQCSWEGCEMFFKWPKTLSRHTKLHHRQ